MRILGGQLDLVLELHSRRQTQAWWFEVKVDSGEHGEQIDVYLSQAAKQTPPATVVTLSREPLRPDVQGLTWQSLRAVIIDAHVPLHSLWDEFRVHLEELNMADNYDEPITVADLSTVSGFHDLFGKVARRVEMFVDRIPPNMQAPEVEWPKESSITRHMLYQFRDHSRLIAYATSPNPYFMFGLWEENESPRWGIWLEASPSHSDIRRKVREAARDVGLQMWHPGTRNDWVVLESSGKAESFDISETAAGFVEQSLRELRGSAVWDLLTHMWKSDAGEPAAVFSEEES